MKIHSVLITLLAIPLLSSTKPRNYWQHVPLKLIGETSAFAMGVTKTFDQFGLDYSPSHQSESYSDDELYVVFDALKLTKKSLPKHYIVYQTLDLSTTSLTADYLEVLRNAISVWDYSWSNITHYKDIIYNYYFFPENYEFADPVIIPCFLTKEAIAPYKELLIYSNKVNTEISSLVPAIFFHSYLKKPKLIVEAGVCLGYSTQAFNAINMLCNSVLLGLDNDPNAQPAYNNIHQANFLLINDVTFGSYYENSPYKQTPLDIVFIDTSHQYEHTMAEIHHFMPLLAADGIFMFHDSNVTPLTIDGRPAFWRINNTIQLAAENPKGVAPAIKQYWGIDFDESQYVNTTFVKNGQKWHFVHYPFCNGLAVLKKIN